MALSGSDLFRQNVYFTLNKKYRVSKMFRISPAALCAILSSPNGQNLDDNQKAWWNYLHRKYTQAELAILQQNACLQTQVPIPPQKKKKTMKI